MKKKIPVISKVEREESYSLSIRIRPKDQEIIDAVKEYWEPIIGSMTIPQVLRMALLGMIERLK